MLSWSGGKDSALALHALRSSPRYEVTGLLTTVTTGYDRISIHGVRRSLLEAQARAVRLPLRTVEIGPGASNEDYAARTGAALRALAEEGVVTVAFGDLFLRDVREYRESLLAQWGMNPIFPLWGRDTGVLAREFIRLGFGAVLVCVDSSLLDGGFSGRDFDAGLLRDLPPGVDACGENGEFHTFVHQGPILSAPIPIERGELLVRDGRFHYCDILSAERRGGSPDS